LRLPQGVLPPQELLCGEPQAFACFTELDGCFNATKATSIGGRRLAEKTR
jgi:hypothetical protein